MHEILLLSCFVGLKCFIDMEFKLRNISQIINSSTNNKDILNLFTNNLLYTTLNVGTPKQNVIINIGTKTNIFYFSSNIFNELYKLNQSIFGINNNTGFYNITLSSTFKNISKYNILSSECSDNFYINNLTLTNINFTLYDNNQENNKICGILGLGINSNQGLQNKFLEQLWNKYYISNFYFSLIYNSNFEGKLLLGELPHNYLPNKYKESELITLYNNGEETDLSWLILIDTVFVQNKNHTKNLIDLDSLNGIIDFSSNTIKGTSKYEKYILNYFFKKYIEEKICFKIENIFYEFTSEMIYCNSKDFEDKLKLFPELILKNNEINYEFKFTYKDLFMTINDKIFFLVNFKIANQGFDDLKEFWTLGIPFLKKFQTVFNPESKNFGFYVKNDENYDNEDSSNNRKFILKLVFCIIVGCGLIAIGLFLGYKLFYKKQRKKKANELDDSYDYIEEGDINVN